MPDLSSQNTRRHRVRVTVRMMMTLVLILGSGLGWIVHRARVQREAVGAIYRASGSVVYESQLRPALRRQALVAQMGGRDPEDRLLRRCQVGVPGGQGVRPGSRTGPRRSSPSPRGVVPRRVAGDRRGTGVAGGLGPPAEARSGRDRGHGRRDDVARGAHRTLDSRPESYKGRRCRHGPPGGIVGHEEISSSPARGSAMPAWST